MTQIKKKASKRERLDALYSKLANLKSSIAFFAPRHAFSRKLIKQNAEFKNLHKGERCFIIGNGPSLNTEDLTTLNGEVVFTVNQISRNPKYKLFKSSYHFWADPAFFYDKGDACDFEIIDVMRNLKNGNGSPICFYPSNQYDFVKRHHLDDDMGARYYLTGYSFYDGYKAEIDYTKRVPGFGTVILWCITMAIYMGFSEIYLLGCDGTGLVNTIQSATNSQAGYEYSYEMTDNEKERFARLLEVNRLEDYVVSYLNCLREYRYMVDYCNKRNISLVNCSSTTAIDCIPRKSLKDVLSTERFKR